MALYQRNRIWYADYYVNGQRVQTSTGTSNKREAEKFMAKRVVQPHKPSRISLEEFGLQYMEYARTNKRSWVRDEQMLKQLNGYFKPALLTDIGQLSVEGYKRHRIEAVAPASVNREVALLKHMFNLATAWGLFHGRNPVKGVKFLPENNLKLRILSPEEEAKLLPCCPQYLRDMVVFDLNTGLRSGDLFELRWEDINRRESYLKIIVQKTRQELELPLGDVLNDILDRWEAMKCCPYVFFYQLSGDRFRDVRVALRNACKQAGITGITWHTFRHTFATRLIAQGTDIVTVKELLGHAEIKTTMRYAHTSKATKKAAVSKLSVKVVTEPSDAE